ncbi:hypothetical protein RR48_13369 [Papilio machaon]|uniref:Uncharacterized protein n=1 Tax=Papilio machaon TaxID=76193 RepID=A0A194QXP9_PAPMA|nr:hypothetical protein RR48_13369 [Papilio machaon]
MVQEDEGAGAGLIAPRRLPNPCLESPQRMDLHRELLFNQRIRFVSVAYSGLHFARLSSQVQFAADDPVKLHTLLFFINFSLNVLVFCFEILKLERAIAERARRLEQAEQNAEEIDPATNPTLQEIRARLRHAAPPAPSPAASAH